jgi:hypothetical protein
VNQFGETCPGFTFWWDRWNGDGWCWRELTTSPFRMDGVGVTEGRGYRSKMAARAACRAEIVRRQSMSLAMSPTR